MKKLNLIIAFIEQERGFKKVGSRLMPNLIGSRVMIDPIDGWMVENLEKNRRCRVLDMHKTLLRLLFSGD